MPNDHNSGWIPPRAQFPWKNGDILIADELNAAIVAASAGVAGGDVTFPINLTDPNGAININRNIAWSGTSTDAANHSFTFLNTITGTNLDPPTAGAAFGVNAVTLYNGFNTGSLGMQGYRIVSQVGGGSIGRSFTALSGSVLQVAAGPSGAFAPGTNTWAQNTAYPLNYAMTNNLSYYVATQAGTSAPSGIGPSGYGSAITDGTVVWAYKGPGVPRYWATSTSYPSRGELVCNPNNGGLFRVETPGTSGASPGPVIPTVANGIPTNAVPDGSVIWSYKGVASSATQQIGFGASSQLNFNAGGKSINETFGHAWGAVIGSSATPNATYYSESVPLEIDDRWVGGPIRKIVALQIVRGGNQAAFTDIGMIITASGSAATSRYKNAVVIGNATDVNKGYALAFEASGTSGRQHMAGAIDMRMVNADGTTGPFGNGFLLRHFNGQLDNNGAWQLRYGSVTPTASGLAIDVSNVELQSIAITSGGANWTLNSWFKGSDGSYGQVQSVDNAQSVGVGAILTVIILLPSQVPAASAPTSITLSPFNPDTVVRSSDDPDVLLPAPRGPSGDVIWPTPATGTPTYAAPATPTLSLMPSGGATVFGGPVNYTATGSTTPRSAQDRAADVVNVKDFGAVFDGASHPLSAYYPTLAAAQAVYPHAVALTDEIDGVAIQAAINLCASRIVSYIGGGIVRLPAGTGCVNQPLVIAASSVSLVGQTEGFQFHSIFVNQPSSTTSLKWTGTARTTSQGPVHFLTVKPDSNGRLNAGSSVRGILFDCNNIAGISGPLFLSCRYAQINVGTRLPNGIAYTGAVLTAGSQSITVNNTAGIPVGTSIVSASLPEGVTVATIVNATTLTVNAQASATSTETVTVGGEGIRFDVQGGLVDTNATQNLDIWFGGQQDQGAANATAPLMIVGGTGTTGAGTGGTSWGNTSVCYFHNIYCVFNNGAAIVFNNSDHNIITNISGLKTGAGGGSLLVLNGAIDPINGGARFHKFGLISGAGAIKVTGTDTGGFTQGSVACVIDLLDVSNGVAYPTVGVAASIRASADTSTPALAPVGDDTQVYSYTAISAHVPDSTIRGGNNRGARAVDLQAAVRTAATQVASGNSSVIGGGNGNTASGVTSVVIGGSTNTASGLGASVLGGVANTASQSYSVATGIGAVAELYGAVVHSCGNIISGRRALHTKQILRASTAANTTPVRLTADALTASAINTCNLPYSDQANALSVQLIAIDSSAAANFYAWYQPLGLLRRDGTLATTVYVPGTPVILTNGTTAGITITEAADTTNGGYSLTFTPPTGNTAVWRVVATVEWTRVDGA